MCKRIVTEDGSVIIVCGRGRHGRAVPDLRLCYICQAPATVLCDGPRYAGQKDKEATCSRPCCRRHAFAVGEDRDLCWHHHREKLEVERHLASSTPTIRE